MPKQTRGFWTCSFCGLTFDRYEEVAYHESHACRRRGRRVSLLREGEVSLQLATFCQSVELFESTEPYTVDRHGNRTVPGQVGLRCVFCVDSASSVPGSVDFPPNLQLLADSVTQMASRHVVVCSEAPMKVRREVEALLESDRTEATAALSDFCIDRCYSLHVINKFPENTGIIFQDSVHVQADPYDVSLMRSVEPVPYTTQTLDRESSLQQATSPHAYEPLPPTHPGHFDHPIAEHSRFVPEQYPPRLDDKPPARRRSDPFEPAYEPPPENFPFAQEPGGDWVCKFCNHIHPHYRDPQFSWPASHRTPPPPEFIDQHLRICQAYHQSLGSQSMYPHYHGPPFMAPFAGGYSPSMEASRGASVPLDYERKRPQRESTEHRGTSESSKGSRQGAIDYLAAHDKSKVDDLGSPLPENEILVLDEDRLLLTDYFFYLMKQLRKVTFTEMDRKTRGGKREKIQLGYAGLQCVHCTDLPNNRKFFWSNVDRLANSFAEIPAHIYKCRKTPPGITDALSELKRSHAAQMSELPRGSQKVFFRRVWRRLHGDDNVTSSQLQETITPKSPPGGSLPDIDTKLSGFSPGTASASDQSIIVMERSSKEAAQVLAHASIQESPPSPSSRVLLAIPEDREWLSDLDCLVRRQIEVFCASKDDVEAAKAERMYPIVEGQVGIRCIHCAVARRGEVDTKGLAAAYPFSVNGVFESVREFQRVHLDICPNLPPATKTKLTSLKLATSLTSVLRKYYILSAKALGLYDTTHGIRAGGESAPLSPNAAFTFSGPDLYEQMEKGSEQESSDAPSSKRQKTDEVELPEGGASI